MLDVRRDACDVTADAAPIDEDLARHTESFHVTLQQRVEQGGLARATKIRVPMHTFTSN